MNITSRCFSYLLSTLTISILFIINSFAQHGKPDQPEHGPGGWGEYQHESIEIIGEYGDKADGFWMYLPASPTPDTANVVIFLHGFAAHNPDLYGGWLRHLVNRGNIVIFPRYQKKMLVPIPFKGYTDNAAKGIKDALAFLEKEQKIVPHIENVVYTGHSYGGKMAAYFAVKYAQYGLPKPKALYPVQPGVIGFKEAQLLNYGEMEEDIKLITVVGQKDKIVGDELALLIFNTAGAKQKNLVLSVADESRKKPKLDVTHVAPCAVDSEFKAFRGKNYIMRIGGYRAKTDVVDFYCYWKLLDALMDCSFYDKNCEYAFGNTEQQTFMGYWSDGNPVEPLRIFTEPIYPKKSKRKNKKIGKDVKNK